MRPQVHHFPSEQGFTLVEVMIAVTIFAIALLGVSSMQLNSLRGNNNANRISGATTTLTDTLEGLLALPYDDADLADTDADGTSQDMDGDGEDDDGGNFGLDDTSAGSADFTTTKGMYTIYWNIAVDQPLPNTKTIKVWVSWQQQGTTRQVVAESIKAAEI